jgi:hypothetical protein
MFSTPFPILDALDASLRPTLAPPLSFALGDVEPFPFPLGATYILYLDIGVVFTCILTS